MTMAACPACVATPHDHIDKVTEGALSFDLSVPSVHCAGCINAIERGLAELNGVHDARVNLSLKRLKVHHDGRDNIEDRVLDKLANLGFEAHMLDAKTLAQKPDQYLNSLLIKLGIAGFAAMNVMLLSVSVWSGAEGATREFLHWVSAAIALPTITFTAQPFFKNAWSALRVGRLNMDVPISLAILLACLLSLYETAMGGEHAYFDAALSLTFFLLAGRYLDHLTRAKARSAALELSALEMPRAQVIKDGNVTTVSVETLSIGDHILVRRGAHVPVDGKVSKGISELDVSLLTGETTPQMIDLDDAVYAGTVNLGGPFEVEVTHIGQGTKLAEIAALVATAETAKTKYTNLADRAARVYAPVVHILALLAFIGWQFYSGDTRLAIGIATAVLIITCPCALGLAVPAVLTAASGRLFRAGVLIRDGAALERMADIDTVVFDKTGTLTTGELRVVDAPSGYVRLLAASLAAQSDHPLSRAVSDLCDEAMLSLTGIVEHSGQGLEARHGDHRIRLGNAKWLGVTPIAGYVQSWFQINDEAPVPFLFEDTIKPSSDRTIALLKKRGLNIVMLSGDNQASADRIAAELGIDTTIANVNPSEKLEHIKAFGDNVLMIGDGLNDTAALAAAHVSISPASAIDASRATSDFVLVRDDMTLIDTIFTVGKSAKMRMLENFGIAAGYNAIAIPIALLGFATPLLAALAMSASSICVSLNAMRLVRGK